MLRDNVISGNDTDGVLLDSNVTEDAVIENNRIGTNDAGVTALGNTLSGIFLMETRRITLSPATSSAATVHMA